LLVYPLHSEEIERHILERGIEFPISLVYVSAALEEAGIDNHILDLRLEQNATGALREKIRSYNPLVVGITVSTPGIEKTAILASQVKAMGIMSKVGYVGEREGVKHAYWSHKKQRRYRSSNQDSHFSKGLE